MYSISKSVVKKDHVEKMAGSSKYIADLHIEHMQYGQIVRSTKAKGKIINIHIPELEEGYYTVDYTDVKGSNLLKVVTSEQPIFAEQEVNYIGEAILMVVGPEEDKVKKIAKNIQIEYEDRKAVLNLWEATECVAEYSYQKGEKELYMETKEVIEETFHTDYQEQAYIEPQGVIGIYQDGKVSIYGSMQCPYYVKGAVVQALGLSDDNVQIIQTTTGGGFGGKEDYPSLLACQAGIAAMKIQKPVRLILNRREDMEVTPKRHPAILNYKAGFNSSGDISSLEVEITLDGGAYAGLSSVVLQRSLIAATGVYQIPNLKIHGKVLTTNTVPTGAFRGFGAPQSFFAIESLMNHIAYRLGMTPLDFKRKYLVKQGDDTATSGRFHHPVLLEEMIDKIDAMSDFTKKYAKYENQESSRYRKGIGMSLFLHGCGFTGSAERDYIKSVVKLVKYKDNTLEILASNTDIGQGLKTTFSKIVAEVLKVPMEQIKIVNPDTDRVPNSGPTVASRSLMIVGKLLERAATRLKEEWKEDTYQVIEEHYKQPYMIPWDPDSFSGDAYPTYSWGVNVVEVEVDTLLATTRLLGVWGVFDVGTPIDETVMKGQMEGGMLQGLGYGSMEKMESKDGRIYQASITDYIIPTAKDTIPFETYMIENPYEDGPFGAKGAGELTIIGTAPAYAQAVELAIQKVIHAIPVTPERIMELLE